ncbi:MAG TPA: XRE family transcriptional regulator [Kiloniellales bacterium]
MKDDMEIVRGSGNVFRDLGRGDTDLEQLKSILAAKIIGVLDDDAISVRDAQAATGTAAADFSRIRNARLGRFTVDRLMTILNRLDRQVRVRVSVQPAPRSSRTMARRQPSGRRAAAAMR